MAVGKERKEVSCHGISASSSAGIPSFRTQAARSASSRSRGSAKTDACRYSDVMRDDVSQSVCAGGASVRVRAMRPLSY